MFSTDMLPRTVVSVVLCSLSLTVAGLGISCSQPDTDSSVEPASDTSSTLDADRPDAGQVLNAGFVVTEAVFNSELMAPYDILHHTYFRDSQAYVRPFIVSETGEPFTTFEGLTVSSHYSFDDAPAIDILVVPSTDNSMTVDLENERYIAWLRETAESASFVITLCDGAFPMAATGLLNGRTATTFPADRDRLAEMFPEVDVRFDANFVVDGKYITSVGGALSYEPALYLVENVYSVEAARLTAEGLVLDWDSSTIPHLVVEEEKVQ